MKTLLCLFGLILLPCLLTAQSAEKYKQALDKQVRDFEQARTVQEKRVYMKKIYSFLNTQAILIVPEYVYQKFAIVYQQVTQDKQLAPLLPLATVMWAQSRRSSTSPAEGVELYFQALELGKQYHDKEVLFDATYNIANDLLDQSKTQEALTNFLALEGFIADPELKDYIQNRRAISLPNLYCVIAQIYLERLEKPNFALAEVYYKKAIQTAKDINDDAWIGLSHGNMSRMYLLQNNFEKWREYLLTDVKYSLRSTNYGSAVGAYIHMTRTYTQQKKYTEAKACLDSLERLITVPLPPSRLFSPIDTAKIYQEFYFFYRATAQYDKAVYANDKYLEISKRNNEANHKKEFEEIQTKYKVKFKEQEFQSLQKQKDTERWILYLVGLVSISLIALALVLFRNNRKQLKTNALLKEHQEELNTQKEALALQAHELEITNQTKDKLFAILGHDLRSPIGSLEGVLNLMKMGVVSQEEFQSFVPQFHKNVKNMQHTLENLLQWSLNQMRGISTSPSSLNLFQVVDEKMELFTAVAQAKNITLSAQVPDNLMVWADLNQVRLLFQNLINNAVKFTPEGGQISIFAQTKDEYVFVSIKDTGVGMSAEQIEKLFSNNQTFSTYGTAGEKGTGLGLSLCKDFVERNGGKIWVESEAGKGSTFFFTLPVDKPENEKYPYEGFLVQNLDNGGTLYKM